MSALPNPLPSSNPTPKPAGRTVKTNRYGRDPKSPSERMRVSDLDTLAPGFILPISLLADLARLSSGNSCTLLILVLWAKSIGRGVAPKNPKERKEFWEGVAPGCRPEWTLALAVSDLAQICRCDERTIERELKALHERKLAEVKKEGKGKISARLLYKTWESLPDYKSNVVELPAPVEPEVEDEAAEQKEGFQRLTGKKPLAIKAGAQSKPIPVQVGVKSVQFQAAGSVDIEFVSVIQAGEQVVKASVPAVFLESLRKQYAASNVSNDLNSGTRHGCRDEKTNHSPVVKVNHPRADELSAIFDPLLKACGCSSLLSTNAVALQRACAEVGDLDHHVLLKFAMLRTEGRKINSPLHVADIIRDCRKAEATPPAKREKQSAAAKPGFTERLKAEAKRRLEKYGKI